MTVFEKIIEAIRPFGYPYTAGVYEGKEKRWFTFNFSDDYGDAYADDTPQSVIVEVQIHFSCLMRKILPELKIRYGMQFSDRGSHFRKSIFWKTRIRTFGI